MIRIQNNFLNNIDFNKIENLINHLHYKINGDSNQLFMYHVFFNQKISSPFFHVVEPLVEDIEKLQSIILYIVPASTKNKIIFKEIKEPLNIKNTITSIYFINKNNGYLKFFGLNDIYPEQNRIFTFDSNFKIENNTCTDAVFKGFVEVVNTK